jgi:MFS transporter, AAHS family, benzoate transport protein
MTTPPPGQPQTGRSTRPYLSNTAVVVLCMLVTVMEGYNLIVFGAVVPLLLQDPGLHIDEQTTGIVGGIVYLGALVGVMLGTSLADRFGRHKIMAASAAVFAIGAVLAALAPTPELLGLARFITGIGVGGAITTAMTLARNHAPHGRASLVITVTMAGVPLGGTLAALLGMFAMPVWGWRPMFLAGAAMTLIILAVILCCRISEPEEVHATHLTPSQKFTALFKSGGSILVLFVALSAITNMVTWLGLNVWLAEAMKGLGFDLTTALLFVFSLTGAAVLGSFIAAGAADRFGSASVTIICAALTLTGLIGVLAGPKSLPMALLFVALMGIGGHSTQNLINATASGSVAAHSRGTILGLTNAMAFIGSFLGPALGGTAFAASGPTGVFGLYTVSAALCLLLCSGLYITSRRHTRRTAPAAEVSSLAVG